MNFQGTYSFILDNIVIRDTELQYEIKNTLLKYGISYRRLLFLKLEVRAVLSTEL